jgi:hypothetical protein
MSAFQRQWQLLPKGDIQHGVHERLEVGRFRTVRFRQRRGESRRLAILALDL